MPAVSKPSPRSAPANPCRRAWTPPSQAAQNRPWALRATAAQQRRLRPFVRGAARAHRSKLTQGLPALRCGSDGPGFDEIHAQVEAVGSLRHTPADTVRIVSSGYAISHVLWLKLTRLPQGAFGDPSRDRLDNGLNAMVAEGCDAGVSRGEHLAKISTRIDPDILFRRRRAIGARQGTHAAPSKSFQCFRSEPTIS